ncbi:MAG: NifB/NifX family molybdenum-iron cluster-binding protein [Sulfolobales archaeon]|nr:NifB/NifX family molybdenum-iron cluster-binding protein [Sulfolobales archaeon]MCX8199304.1 NifB/NifX family molybdenum-iron cluster-binding protein [Sulfolobales archaeon]MDW8170382.1 NifB/NifX family molybdenum-iron cluster-binding protein [Desulfurococcaceae archaeon]
MYRLALAVKNVGGRYVISGFESSSNLILLDLDENSHREVVDKPVNLSEVEEVFDENDVAVLVCSNISSESKAVIEELGVKVITGVDSTADEFIEKWL